MILYNARIYNNGELCSGFVIINEVKIKTIKYNPTEEDLKIVMAENMDDEKIDCENKIIIPGIIDIHSHLRDMGQSEKETFESGTKAAGMSGITTVFNMPNTKPPAITAKQIKNWMDKAKNNIYINVGFISGVPERIDEEEVKKIIKLGVIGFKIYPLNSLNGIDWTDRDNIQKLLAISSRYQVPIFIHPDWPLSEQDKELIFEKYKYKKNLLKLHDKLYPGKNELKYVKFIIQNYENYIRDKKFTNNPPIIHFCHISHKKSYDYLKDGVIKNHNNYRITFEITPHHLLLSNDIQLNNYNFGKVLPPLRNSTHSSYLFNELIKGNICLIGTDHAPHTLEEKNQIYSLAPSGLPGFETYARLFLKYVLNKKMTLKNYVEVSSENPAKIFGLKNKGFIKEGFDADLVIIDEISSYQVDSNNFISKAKFSPFDGLRSNVQIWKTIVNGKLIRLNEVIPEGKIIIRE